MRTAFVTRAEVGEVLRSRRTALTGDGVSGTAPAVSDASRRLAAELERTVPGLPLMLQMRARLFDQAVAAAPGRGLRALVSIAAGFDERRLRTTAFAPGGVWEVDHPAVLAAKAAPRPGVARCGVAALEGAGWVTRLIREAPLADATFFVVHNPALWAAAPLHPWLAELAAAAAPGSEMLLNLLPDDAGPLPMAGAAVCGPDAAAHGSAAAVVPVAAATGVLGLVTVAAFDSLRLQRAYLGAEDLLVHEIYLWLAKPYAPAARRSAAPSLAALVGWRSAPGARALTGRADDARPRLRRDVRVRRRADGAWRVVRAVTPWRRVGVVTDDRGAAIARRLDGTRTLAEVGAALAGKPGVDAGVVATTVAALRRVGFVVESGSTGSSRAPRRPPGRAALAALARGDRAAAGRLTATLDAEGGPPARAHLRTLVVRVSRDADLDIAGRASFYVVGRCSAGPDAAQTAGVGRQLLVRLAALLECRRLPTVVLDLSSARPGRPLTHVAAADPYTLVWMPVPAYSTAVLAHELTHALADAPSRWLAEGLAVWAQRRIAPGPCFPDDAALASSIEVAPPPDLPLATLLGDPTAASPVLRAVLERPSRRAYRQAADFVEFFVQRFGLGALRRLFRAGVRSPHDDAVARVCRGVGSASVADLEQQWRRARIRRES